MFTIGYKYNNKVFSQEVRDWKKAFEFLVSNGRKILYVYHTENNRPVFDYKGD